MQLIGAYVHDDRLGPYVSTLLEKDKRDNMAMLYYRPRGEVKVEEKWIVTHILIPSTRRSGFHSVGFRKWGSKLLS